MAPPEPAAPPRGQTDEDQLQLHLANFLAVPANNRPATRDHLANMLQNAPQWEDVKHILPVDEFERRILLIERFQSYRRGLSEGAQLSRLDYVALMVMPLNELTKKTEDEDQMGLLARSLKELVKAVRSLLKNDRKPATNIQSSKKRGASGGKSKATKRRSGSGVASKSSVAMRQDGDDDDQGDERQRDSSYGGSVHRNQTQRDAAFAQDEGQCQVTGFKPPEVCHIIPFSWNDNTDSLKRTQGFEWSFSLFDIPLRATLCIASLGLGASDIASNMICMSPALHPLWDNGYIGFKFLGNVGLTSLGEVEMKLQVVWMPNAKKEGFSVEDIIDLNKERDPSAESFIKKLRSMIGAKPDREIFGRCGWPVTSGDVFTVRRPAADTLRFTGLIELRWYLGLIAAMSGAAGDDEFINGQDDEFEKMHMIGLKIAEENRLRDEEEEKERQERQEKRQRQERTKEWVAASRPRLASPPPPPEPRGLTDLTNRPRLQHSRPSGGGSSPRKETGSPSKATVEDRGGYIGESGDILDLEPESH